MDYMNNILVYHMLFFHYELIYLIVYIYEQIKLKSNYNSQYKWANKDHDTPKECEQ